MSYRKQISYLELQENGQRIRGAGYAKLGKGRDSDGAAERTGDRVWQGDDAAVSAAGKRRRTVM